MELFKHPLLGFGLQLLGDVVYVVTVNPVSLLNVAACHADDPVVLDNRLALGNGLAGNLVSSGDGLIGRDDLLTYLGLLSGSDILNRNCHVVVFIDDHG